MGLKSSTLLQEEDIEELQNETGCKLKAFCENLRLLKLPADIKLKLMSDSTMNFELDFSQFLQIRSKGFTADLQVLINQPKEH